MAEDRRQMLIEADRRGLLTGQVKADYDEAVRRGLIVPPSEPAPSPANPAPVAAPAVTDPGAQIPEPITSMVNPPQPGLSRFVSRPAFQMAGGLTGAALATPAAPLAGPAAPAVPVAGGALGSAAGGQIFDVVEDVLGRLGVIEPNPANVPTLENRARTALGDVAEDAAFGGGFAAAAGLKPAMAQVLGLAKPAAQRLAQQAANLNVPIGAATLSDSGLVKSAKSVFGVFPVVSGPLKRGAAATAEGINAAAESFVDDLAPNATLAELGVDLTEAAKRRYRGFTRVTDALFKDFYRLAEQTGAQVPTTNIKAMADDLAATISSNRPTVGGEPLPSPRIDAVSDYITTLRSLPDTITPEQYRSIIADLKALDGRAAAEGLDVRRIVRAKSALEDDLANIVGGDDVKAALDRANEWYGRNIATFRSPTGKRFGRVDRNIFRPGFKQSGTLDADEIMQSVFRAGSPQAVADLRRVVGPGRFKRVVRSYLDDAFKAAATSADGGLSFDPFKLEQRLGLVGTRRAMGENLPALLKQADIDPERFQALLDVSRQFAGKPLPDVSTFLTRRVTLGGLRSLMGGALMGAAATANFPAAVGLTFLARQGAKALASDTAAKNLMQTLDDTLPQQVRNAAMGRLYNALLESEEGDFQTTLRPFGQSAGNQ